MKRSMLACVLLVVASSAVRSDEVKEFVYKKAPEGALKMFVHYPPGWNKADKRPAIVFFFGGGWRQGRIEQFVPQMFPSNADPGIVRWVVDQAVASDHAATIALMRDFPKLDMSALFSSAKVPIRCINAAPVEGRGMPTAIESNRQPQHRAELLDNTAMLLTGDVAVRFVLFLGAAPAVIAGQIGNGFNLYFGVAQKFTVANQVIGVFVMGRVADEVSTVVQNSRCPQQFSLFVSPFMQ